MERNEFIKKCSLLFKDEGFIRKGTSHFYKDISDDVMIVIAFDHSSYDKRYYIDGGFVIKPLNPYMPFPKYSFANIRYTFIYLQKCNQSHLKYEEFSDEDFSIFENAMRQEINYMSLCTDRESIVEKIIFPCNYTYCKDYRLYEYFYGSIPRSKLTPMPNQV